MQATELFPSTSYIGKVNHRFSQITSTNNFAKKLVAKGEPVHGSVILSDYQTSGRGQTGRYWHSSAGQNLLTTVILSPKSSIVSLQFYFNKVIALSVASTVSKLLEEDIKIKWPNDILVGEQKIAGILIENLFSGNQLQHCLVGIGLNVNQQFFPAELNHATSLFLEKGLHHDILNVAELLFIEIEKNYQLLTQNQFKEIDNAYHKLLFRINEPNLFRRNGKQYIGTIKLVDEHGQLHVEIDNEIHFFRNQEIEFVF